jgi:hypothetical protein
MTQWRADSVAFGLLQILQPRLRSPVYQLLWNSRATPAFGTVRVRGEKVATSVDVSCDHVPLRAFREVVQRLTSQKSGGAVFIDQVGLSNFLLGDVEIVMKNTGLVPIVGNTSLGLSLQLMHKCNS